MTPLANMLERVLPAKAAVAVLALVYAAMLFCTVALIGHQNIDPSVYFDGPVRTEWNGQGKR